MSQQTRREFLSSGASVAGVAAIPRPDFASQSSERVEIDIEATVNWNSFFGYDEDDRFYDVIRTNKSDEYLAIGYETGDSTEDTGEMGAFVVRFTIGGKIQWQKVINVDRDLVTVSGIRTADGNFLICGNSGSEEDTRGHIIKLNPQGGVIYQRRYGSDIPGVFQDIAPLGSGGAVAVGGQVIDAGSGFISDVTYKSWAVGLDSGGDVQWQTTIPEGTLARSVSISDHGILFAGGDEDTLEGGVFRLSLDGSIEWGLTYESVAPWGVRWGPNGDVIIKGTTETDSRGEDLFVSRLNGEGSRKWAKVFGGDGEDSSSFDSMALTDDGILIGGWTNSTGFGGSLDGWVTKVSFEGDWKWSRTVGGGNKDWVNTVLQLEDGDILAAGTTESFGEGSGKNAFITSITNPANEATGAAEAQDTGGDTDSDQAGGGAGAGGGGNGGSNPVPGVEVGGLLDLVLKGAAAVMGGAVGLTVLMFVVAFIQGLVTSDADQPKPSKVKTSNKYSSKNLKGDEYAQLKDDE